MNKFHNILEEVSEKAGWSDDSLIFILCEYIQSCEVENITPDACDFRQYVETRYQDELSAHEGC